MWKFAHYFIQSHLQIKVIFSLLFEIVSISVTMVKFIFKLQISWMYSVVETVGVITLTMKIERLLPIPIYYLLGSSGCSVDTNWFRILQTLHCKHQFAAESFRQNVGKFLCSSDIINMDWLCSVLFTDVMLMHWSKYRVFQAYFWTSIKLEFYLKC